MKSEIIEAPGEALAIGGLGGIGQLLAHAVDRLGGEGTAAVADAIGKLVLLRQQEEDRAARRGYFEAFSAFRADCPQIKRSRKAEMVTKSGSKRVQFYADLSEFESTVRPHLYSRGFSWRWDTVPDENTRTFRVTCTLMHSQGHQESATVLVPLDSSAPMNAAQQHGAAFAYGQRYSLAQVLGLVTTDDDSDGVPPENLVGLTDAQRDDILNLIDVTGSDTKKFLSWLGYETIEDMKRQDYDRAIKALRAKAPR